MHNLQQPGTIYQFASVESAKKIIEHRKLKFSRPFAFNDPFDCDIDLLDFIFDGDLSDAVKKEIEAIKQRYPNPASPLLDPKSELCILKDIFKGNILQKVNDCWISCFSLTNAPVLMWSHYANKHAGVCIEFNNHALPRFPGLEEDKDVSEGIVSYKAHERVNFFATEIKAALAKLFLSKSESWSYECEYRMILFNKNLAFHEFSPAFISGIYFGLKVSEEDMTDIIQLSSKNFNHLKFYRSNKRDLTLSFTPL